MRSLRILQSIFVDYLANRSPPEFEMRVRFIPRSFDFTLPANSPLPVAHPIGPACAANRR